MSGTIKNQATLSAEIDSTFPTNNNEEITAEDLRNYLQDALASQRIQVKDGTLMVSDPTNLSAADIDENKPLLNSLTPKTINLPPLMDLEEGRTLVINTLDSNQITLNPDGSDSLIGPTTVNEQAYIQCIVVSNAWFVVPVRLTLDVGVETIVAGTATTVDNSDPANPIVSHFYDHAEDTGSNNDVPDSWTQICTITHPTVVGGVYMLIGSAGYTIDATNNSVGARISGDHPSGDFMMESKDNTDRRSWNIGYSFVATGASTTVNMDFMKESSGNTLDVDAANLNIFRVG